MCIEGYSFNKQFEYLLDMRHDVPQNVANIFSDPYIAPLPFRTSEIVPMTRIREEKTDPKVNRRLGLREGVNTHWIVGSF